MEAVPIDTPLVGVSGTPGQRRIEETCPNKLSSTDPAAGFSPATPSFTQPDIKGQQIPFKMASDLGALVLKQIHKMEKENPRIFSLLRGQSRYKRAVS